MTSNAIEQQMDFSKQLVWVTGAGRGIGWQTARLFAQLGARVIGLDMAFESDTHFLFKAVELDVADSQVIDQNVPELLASYGPPDVFINSAGILRLGAVDELSRQDWHSSLNTNLSACFYFLHYLIPEFKARGTGAMVTVCSNATAMPRYKMAAYAASKAALLSLTKTVGLELAEYGIRVNSVSPGSTMTPMQTDMWGQGTGKQDVIRGNLQQFRLGIPLQKIAEPIEIAQTIAFLASPLASHITMQDIVVDGGATMGV